MALGSTARITQLYRSEIKLAKECRAMERREKIEAKLLNYAEAIRNRIGYLDDNLADHSPKMVCLSLMILCRAAPAEDVNIK